MTKHPHASAPGSADGKNEIGSAAPSLTISRWALLLIVVLAAAVTLVYVNNVIRVNTLLVEVQKMERTRDSLVSVNEALRVELTRLHSADRITSIARDHLGMVSSTEAPTVITTKPHQ